MRKVLLAKFNQCFCGIFHVFSHLAIPPKEHGKSPALSELNWYSDRNFTQPALLIKTKPDKRKTLYNYILMALTANRVNTNNKSNERLIYS